MNILRMRSARLVALAGLLATLAGAGLVGVTGTTAAAAAHLDTQFTAADSTASPTTRERMVRIAKAELANDSRNHEVGNDECNFYSGAMGHTLGDCKEGWAAVEWCADFSRFVWKTAGNVAHRGDLDSFANSFKDYGQMHGTWHAAGSGYSPKPGDAIVYDYDHNGRANHVGLVVENLGGGEFRTIEGNTTDPNGGRDRINTYLRKVSHSGLMGFTEPVLDEPDRVEHVYKTGAAGLTFNRVFHSFFRRADNRVVRHNYIPNEGWLYHDMAGSVLSTPTAIEYRGDLWVFARGADNQVTYRVNTGTAWSDWRWIPGNISGAPAVGSLDERMFVVVREGNALKYRYYDLDEGWNEAGTWLGAGQPSETVRVVTDPVIGQLNGRLVVVVRGSDGYTWLRWIGQGTTPQWTSWTKLSGAIAGTPAVATDGDDLHIFVRTPDGVMRYHTYTKGASSWIHNRGLGSAPEGTFTGSPAAVSFSDLLTVSVRNSAGQLLYRTLNNGVWSAWLQLGKPGTATLDSSPVAMQNYATRYIAARADNEELYVRSFREDSGWSSWTHLPSNLALMP